MEETLNVGYVRVSTIEQAVDGYSLITQRKRIEDKFKELKINNFNIIVDDGYSASTLERPGFKQILKLMKSGKIKNFCFVNQDRLSRSISDVEELMVYFKRYCVNVYCIEGNFAYETPEDLFNVRIKGILSQNEREMISYRTKKGYEGAALEGKYPYPKVPYGFKKTEDKKLVKIDDEIEVVKKIYRLYNYGHSEKVITEQLNDKGIQIDKYKVKRILANEIYQGYIYANGKKFQIVEPVAYKSTERVRKARSRVSRKHNYILNNVYYENDKEMRKLTKIKPNGKKYVYYYRDGVYVNQQQILEDINRTLFSKLKDKQNDVIEQLSKDYIKNKINTEEFMMIYKNIIDEQLCYNLIKKVIISKDKEIKIII